MIKAATEILRWLYWYPLRFTIQLLSLKQIYWLCRVLAVVMVFFSKRVKAVRNELLLLKKVIQTDNDDDFKKNVFQTMFVYICNEIELFYFPKLNSHNIRDAIQYKGIEHLEQALSHGKGVMLLFAHFGANQMIMPALGYLNFKVNQIAAKPMIWKEILGNQKMTAMQKKGLNIRWELEKTLPAVFIDPFISLKKAFKVLKNNEILTMAVDGGAGKRNTELEFLGKKIFMPHGSFEIAFKTKCEVLIAFMVRDKSGINTLIIEPIEMNNRKIEKQEYINNGIREFAKRLEAYVIRYPCHYVNYMALKRYMKSMGISEVEQKHGKGTNKSYENIANTGAP